MDEVDSYTSTGRVQKSEKSEELRGILNSGHDKDSAYVTRAEKMGDGWETRDFSTFAPISFAGIGSLPSTWEDVASGSP